MSYLHAPRLVFTGDFLSDVSTVNNDTAHYNNATFKPNFQEPGQGASNGWWNPEGGAVFDFQNCTVQQIFLPDGTTQTDSLQDIIIGQVVAGAEGRPTGKMVDLDPDAQMVSALWCVQLRICNAQNELLFKGDLETTCFRDIQFRQTDGGKSNGQPLGASWTSVLTNVVWGELAETSPFLNELKNTTHGDKLSINLNPFGYYYAHNDGRFSLGRIIGSIGPYFEGEPTTFAATRRLYGIKYNTAIRSTYFSNTNFLVEKDKKRLSIDFGASFPVSDSIGTINFNQELRIAVSQIPLDYSANKENQTFFISSQNLTQIGTVNYQSDPGWLNKTGGIISFDELSDDVISLLANNQLILVTPSSTNPDLFAIIARESTDGLFVRADNFVQRLDAGDTTEIDFYAYQYGEPLASTSITITLQPPTPDTPFGTGQNENPISIVYGNNYPVDGISFQSQVITNAHGKARMKLTGNSIQSPRVYIDGQIYTMSYQLIAVDPAFGTETIEVHLRDDFKVIEKPVWEDISSMMIQYSNLYPIMSKYVVNLADPEDLILKKNILIFAFSRAMQDTMHMPVTRDLSNAKRQTILNWLNNPEIEKRTILKSSFEQSKPENPVAPGSALSDSQIKYREAVKAKNGSFPHFQSVDNLFENI